MKRNIEKKVINPNITVRLFNDTDEAFFEVNFKQEIVNVSNNISDIVKVGDIRIIATEKLAEKGWRIAMFVAKI